MIYEYAVSPKLFGSLPNLGLLFHAFAASSGRMVSDYPRRKWTQLARELIARTVSEDSERKEYMELLMALEKYALVERQGPLWTKEKNWIDNAMDEHHQRPFHGILVDAPISNEPRVIAMGASMQRHAAWQASGTSTVPRRAADMVKSVVSLIEMSTTLVLVDRNFDPADGRFSNVLATFADRIKAQAHQPRIQQIKFVTTYEKFSTAAAFEERCRDFLPGAIPIGISVSFHLKAKNLLHKRVVLTDRGCVLFDPGLDEGIGEALIGRLSIDEFQSEWSMWNKNVVSTFTIDGKKPK